MELFIAAKLRTSPGGHGDPEEPALAVVRQGPYSQGGYPPLFAKKDDAEQWSEARGWDGVVGLSIDDGQALPRFSEKCPPSHYVASLLMAMPDAIIGAPFARDVVLAYRIIQESLPWEVYFCGWKGPGERNTWQVNPQPECPMRCVFSGLGIRVAPARSMP